MNLRTSSICIFLLLASTVPSASAALPETITWRADLKEAANEMSQQGRPMLLLFTMDGCSYCQLMKRTTYADQQVTANINEHFVPTRVDGNEHRQLAQRLGVRVYPTTVIISSDNRVIDRMDGYVKPHAILPRLTAALQTERQARTAGSTAR